MSRLLNGVATKVAFGNLDKAEMLALFEELIAREHATIQFYGRCGRLGLQLLDQIDSNDAPGLLQEVAELKKFVLTFEADNEPDLKVRNSIISRLDRIQQQIGNANAERKWVKSHPPPKNPLPPPVTESRLTFHRLDVSAPWLDIKKCTNDFDVAWTSDSVATIGQDGTKTLFKLHDQENAIYGVDWDGKYFWIASAQKLFVISVDGELLTEISIGSVTKEGDCLPGIADYGKSIRGYLQQPDFPLGGYSAPLQIHCVKAGQCVAIGTMAEADRVWMANIQLAEKGSSKSRISINVFHESIYSPPRESSKWRKPSSTFKPQWTAELRLNERRCLLIGRQVTDDGFYPLRPIAVDLQTLTVEESPLPTERFSPHQPCAHREQMLTVNGWGKLVLCKKRDAGTWYTIDLNKRHHEIGNRTPFLLKSGDRIVSPGPQWVSVDPESEDVDVITTTELPLQYRFHRYAVSANHGIGGLAS